MAGILNWRTHLGVLRSRLMYYWKPGNRRRIMAFYSQFISEGDLCFDIGAHLGNRADAWVGLGAEVVAVEPQPVCIEFMERKFRDSPVSIIPKAAGAALGTEVLHISHATPTISTLSDAEWRETMNEAAWYGIRWEERRTVDVITLDSLIEEFGLPAFCKIDVENYEAEVLRGLTHAIPALSFEYFPPAIENALACFDELARISDYEFNWSFGESQILESDEWIRAKQMMSILRGYRSHREYGDVYARLAGAAKLKG